MFTGIIQAKGSINALQARGGDMRIGIAAGDLSLEGVRVGDSIAVSGVCLTVTSLGAGEFFADVSTETLSCTTLGGLAKGDAVNLETALTLQTPLGGHLVSGHVDGIGEVTGLQDDHRSLRLTIKAPDELARYIAAKGSICVDGVSLTVNTVCGNAFEVNIVPHTLDATIVNEYRDGRAVNLEVDLVARYLERLLLGEDAAKPQAGRGVTLEVLEAHGFIGRGGT